MNSVIDDLKRTKRNLLKAVLANSTNHPTNHADILSLTLTLQKAINLMENWDYEYYAKQDAKHVDTWMEDDMDNQDHAALVVAILEGEA